jgi:membrane protease YdiL (CAAX protease family)
MPEASTGALYKDSDLRSRRVLLEAVLLLGIMLVPVLIWPSLRSTLAFLPLVYILIEQRARRRPWSDLGVRIHGFRAAVARNWYLVVIAVVSQPITVLAARAWNPVWLDHMLSRLPVREPRGVVLLLALMPVVVFIEEIIYRGFFQQRISWFAGNHAGIAAVAVAFGLMHLHRGVPSVVALDIGLIAIDGVIYGIMFARGENIFVPWLAHLVGNLCGLACLLSV